MAFVAFRFDFRLTYTSASHRFSRASSAGILNAV